MQPLVSILIPNYNKACYLRATLDSVLNQTYANWECIVVDDHSTDESWSILEEYTDLDSRFRVFRTPRDFKRGGNGARNFGFELSKGCYIQWLDSDDVIHPRKIEIQLEDLLQEGGLAISVSNWATFDVSVDLEILLENYRWNLFPNQGVEFLLALWKMESYVPHHAYFFSREVQIKAGMWDSNLIRNQDGEMMTRILVNANKIIFSNEVLAYYRMPNHNHTSRQVSENSLNSLLDSYRLSDKWLLDIADTPTIREILALNYQRLIKLIIREFPEIAQSALDQINILIPSTRYRFNIRPVLFLGSWIGIRNFLRLRKALNRIGFLTNDS